MNKINFENLPSTNTPLSAENLNLLQDNIEDAIPTLDTAVSTSSTNGVENQAITNYVNNLFQPKNLWNGTKYTTGDTLELSENLQTGHLYMITCKGISASFTVTLPFLYMGSGNVQIAYSNVAGGTSEGFRYRFMVSGTTLTIDSNSQNNIANTAILRVDKII